MSWYEFKLVLNAFVIGVAVGWFLNPLWRAVKKIIAEAKLARKEW